MRPKTLGILAATVAVAAAFIALYEQKLPSTDERRERQKRLFRLEADDVVALEIESGGTKVKLERDGRPADSGSEPAAFPPARDWRLLAPMSARGDRALADKLAGELAGLEIARTLEGVERKDVGLVAPRGTIRWRTAKSEGGLEIGGEVPASSDVVVAAADRSELFVVGKAIAEALTRAPGDWRAKEVVAATREQIERIRIVPAGGSEVVLSRKGEGWTVEKPFADLADRDLVDPLLAELTGLRAEKFLDAPLAVDAEHGLAATVGRLELSVAGSTQPLSIELGAEVAPGANRYVRVAGQSLEAKTNLAETFARAAAAWRSRAWTGFDSWKIERIRIDDASGKIELRREAGDWQRDGVEIPYTEVGDLLYAVTSARAETVVAGETAQATAVGAPRATLVFSDANGAEETLTLHAPGATGVSARVSGRDVVLELETAKADEVLAKIAAVRAAKPVVEAGAAVAEPAAEVGTEPASDATSPASEVASPPGP